MTATNYPRTVLSAFSQFYSFERWLAENSTFDERELEKDELAMVEARDRYNYFKRACEAAGLDPQQVLAELTEHYNRTIYNKEGPV